MRILFISAYLPGRGLHGGSSRIFELLHFLHQNHDIYLLTFLNRHDDESKIPELKKICARVEIVPISRKRPFYLYPFEPFIDYQSEEFARKLIQIIREEEIDLVQYEYVQMGIFHHLIPDFPSILTEHELNFLALRKKSPFITNPLRRLKNHYDSLQMMRRELGILKNMDRVICMNALESEALLGFVEEKVLRVLPHGLDTEHFIPLTDVEEEENSIGFFGAYHHYPNVDAVLYFVDQIWPKVKTRVPNAQFYVIGINPPPELDVLNERSDITVTGYVPDIRTALAKCSVLVAPIRQGLGMRVKMLEAMAMAKPVVATELACEGLDVTDGQQVIISNQSDTFAESIDYLLQDRKCRENLGMEARKLIVEQYNYEQIGIRLEQIYQELLSEK